MNVRKLVLSLLCFVCVVFFSPFILPLLILSLTSCQMIHTILYGPSDREIFCENYEPLEWNNDYIVAYTAYMQTIQIWDSSTAELVKSYPISKEGRLLDITSMCTGGKKIWMVAESRSTNLYYIDIPTGEVKCLDLEFTPYNVSYIKNPDDNKEYIIVTNRYLEGTGIAISLFDVEGNKIKDCWVKHDDIRLSVVFGASVKNNNIYLIMCCNEEIQRNGDNSNLYTRLLVIPLRESSSKNDFRIVEEYVPVMNLISDEMMTTLEKSPDYVHEFGFVIDQSWKDYTAENLEDFVGVYAFGSNISIMNQVKVLSYEPFEFEYTKAYGEVDEILQTGFGNCCLTVRSYNDYIFTYGEKLYYKEPEEPDKKTTASVCIYDQEGLIKEIKLKKAYNAFVQFKSDGQWIARNNWILEYDNNNKPIWYDSGNYHIYKIDYEACCVYEYNEDGTIVNKFE